MKFESNVRLSRVQILVRLEEISIVVLTRALPFVVLGCCHAAEALSTGCRTVVVVATLRTGRGTHGDIGGEVRRKRLEFSTVPYMYKAKINCKTKINCPTCAHSALLV